jgi:hypothetical protein
VLQGHIAIATSVFPGGTTGESWKRLLAPVLILYKGSGCKYVVIPAGLNSAMVRDPFARQALWKDGLGERFSFPLLSLIFTGFQTTGMSRTFGNVNVVTDAFEPWHWSRSRALFECPRRTTRDRH